MSLTFLCQVSTAGRLATANRQQLFAPARWAQVSSATAAAIAVRHVGTSVPHSNAARTTASDSTAPTTSTKTTTATTATTASGPSSVHPNPGPLPGFNHYARAGHPFKLTDAFLAKYANVPPPFGFDGLGELVYYRTYSRLKPNGENEQWYETVARVVNGTFNLQRQWIEHHHLGWDARKAQATAQRMYDRIFHMKFLPPGRGLWAMGSPITETRRLFAALNNCAFISTADMWETTSLPSEPFTFLMDASMLGVGVGFDTKGANHRKSTVHGPNPSKPTSTMVILDSREGWVDSVGALIDSYFDQKRGTVEFDYTLIRPAGLPIKGFGGLSSGSEPLRQLHDAIRGVLDAHRGKPLSVTGIVDIMNLIGKCVVAGNVRRTAEIAFGDANDAEYIDLKNYQVNPHRAEFGWTSNNSVFCQVGMNYKDVCERVRINGEPGFFWLDNARQFGRMNGVPDNKDWRASGGNPCLEQTLESHELCCLVETFPNNHKDFADFQETLKLAYLYAKTVTLAQTHWPKTNRVMLRNRRIGCGISGVAQFVSARGLEELRDWCERGYDVLQSTDKEVSDWLAIPRSIKTTTVKPSGTVSILAGATPGMHYPESRYCLRRVRLSRHSNLVQPLIDMGYTVEPAVGSEDSTLVVEFPIDFGPSVRGLKDVSMWEQLNLAAFLQKHWSDNQVSCTVTFDPESEGPHLAHALQYYQYALKGVSFLPRMEMGAYPQMPYEAITKDQYDAAIATIQDVRATLGKSVVYDAGVKEEKDPEAERFCNNDTCAL
ncbi:ribonucleoside-triphosphate reductase, adenosylcobalamin-dependent [Allomyces macrogynus ATCC 38327]|uniref:ribonucleoside-triphosphate reductase (thioredoxin) n=1 Tax=Allomyces macrogynus (strain ATCC 38327) TaxID=578462 RepID=A0A0L0T1V1_ALLM3|nr:ribonucleoside-triphosphate reductase, adenosylcobalamin-dependent [Allomyces macrogynus ATCC 38327]|eukprot:KNE68712.1 ribonucleoside-triphosphate reductase, adenosylcobalamin-dependent [Allomyces macrogynus ATCC 38327]